MQRSRARRARRGEDEQRTQPPTTQPHEVGPVAGSVAEAEPALVPPLDDAEAACADEGSDITGPFGVLRYDALLLLMETFHSPRCVRTRVERIRHLFPSAQFPSHDIYFLRYDEGRFGFQPTPRVGARTRMHVQGALGGVRGWPPVARALREALPSVEPLGEQLGQLEARVHA